MKETACPAKSSRNSRCRRSGPRSSVVSDSSRRSRRGPCVGGTGERRSSSALTGLSSGVVTRPMLLRRAARAAALRRCALAEWPAVAPSRSISFTRAEWARLRAATPLTLDAAELERLRGLNDQVDMQEGVEIYLPLSRLLNLYVAATQGLFHATDTFLGNAAATSPKVPYVIGVAGSVAVGKSTTSRILRALLARWPDHPKVGLVTTDGFLYPNKVLEERGIMNRKGFPESYDTRRLLEFLRAIKSGAPEVSAPIYSHVVYDIVDGEETIVTQPDILILEGLNVLQVGSEANEFVSDYFDF